MMSALDIVVRPDAARMRPSERIGQYLVSGDPVDFLSAAAYTASYASVEFNGFPPLVTHCI